MTVDDGDRQHRDERPRRGKRELRAEHVPWREHPAVRGIQPEGDTELEHGESREEQATHVVAQRDAEGSVQPRHGPEHDDRRDRVIKMIRRAVSS